MGSGGSSGDVTVAWEKDAATARAAATFAARVVAGDAAYISHGEIQTGLSDDGTSWSPALPELYAADFAELGDDRDLLVARTADGVIVGMAIVAWEQSERRRFAVLEDMAVDPNIRSHGIGGRIVAAVKERVRDRGIEWLFLESGVRNTRAHSFFERSGFAEISHVFAARIAPE